MRLCVEEGQETDLRLYLDDDDSPVVSVQPGLLSEKGEQVIARALVLLGEYLGDVTPYPRELAVRRSIDEGVNPSP